jgi:ethanolamine permease
MTSADPADGGPGDRSELDRVVEELASEAQVRVEALRPDERRYLREHALKKPMGVLHIWALGVGVVITGAYFGWNPGLKEGGPLGMLLASLFVCALYMLWVLALAELSVAMPFAGGPLAYGRRAVGPGFGFVMGWSMFLESLFATIGTAIATGGAVYFIVGLLADGADEDLKDTVTLLGGLATVLAFALLQCAGAREQAKVMEWMTYGAIFGLVWFWIACLPGIQLERIIDPGLTAGWVGVVKAVPYAIWFLVMIETVALAPEEAHEPHRTIPRGLALAQATLIVLVVFTWFFVAAAANDYEVIGDEDTPYPLQAVYKEVWPGATHRWHLVAFAVVALFGMIASYNGMLYAISRQSFSLGRAGYLPRILGHVHPGRRTPTVSILVWSLVVAGFVVWGYFNRGALDTAVLTCNLTALVWYALAMVCLFVLRVHEPGMPRPYRVPLYPVLPALVLLMSLAAAAAYGWYYMEQEKEIVILLTLLLYAAGMVYYSGYARKRLAAAAPEELAARAAGGRDVLRKKS